MTSPQGDNPQQGKNSDKYQTSSKEILRAYGMISVIGIDLAACTIGGTLLGRWLDQLWGTTPWMLLVGILVGLGAGVYGVIKLLAVFGPGKQ